MNKYLVCLLLLCIGICLYADGADKPQATSYSKAQMDSLVEQFKKSYGFTGTISYDLDFGVFTGLEGEFKSFGVIDSVSIKPTATNLLSILEPYFKIDQSQLSDWEIWGMMAFKNQVISGIKFEDNKGLSFIFNERKPGHSIVGCSFIRGLDFSSAQFISKEQAEEINLKNTGKKSSEYSTSKLLICSIIKPESGISPIYLPCWRILVRNQSRHHVYYINAITGEAVKDMESPHIK